MSIIFSNLNSFYAGIVHQLSHIYQSSLQGKKFSFKKYEAQEKKPMLLCEQISCQKQP